MKSKSFNKRPKLKWIILYRREQGNLVVIYEPLKRYQLIRKLQQGWKKVY